MKLEWRSQLDPGIFIKENGDGYSSSISRGKAQLAEHVHLEARVAIRRAYYDHDKVCGEEYKASLSIHQASDVFDLMGFCPSPSLWCSEWSTKILQPSKSDEAAIANARHYVERMANGVDKMIDLSIADFEALIELPQYTESGLVRLRSSLETAREAKQFFLSFFYPPRS